MNPLDCGHTFTPMVGTPGYGLNADDGSRICYQCCTQLDRLRMAHGQSFVGYLSSDGTQVTNWSGLKLATVTAEKTSRHNIGRSLTRIWALDDLGQHWYGSTPGRGMYCRLRLSKPETAKHQRRYPQHVATWETRKALRTT